MSVVLVWDEESNERENGAAGMVDVLEQIRALDGSARTLVTVLVGDASAVVGGNASCGLVMYVSFDGSAFHQLSEGSPNGGGVRVIAGGQEGESESRFVVDLETVEKAIVEFMENQRLEKELAWEVS